jgi:predicted aspartyl protease
MFLNLKPVGKPTFRLQVLADTGATRSLISLSTANKHGCEITATSICLSAANGTKIDVSGTTSLHVVDKGKRIHTIVAVVSMTVDQTIIGWKDLMAMGIISPDWPALPRQEAEGRILAADKD